MAKLTDRSELTTPADGDFYVTTDVSDTTDAATGTDKKITWLNIKANLKTYFDTLYGSGAGDVVGPASAVNNRIATFNTTTGKLIQDGGATIAQVRDRSTHTGTQTSSTISDFETSVETYAGTSKVDANNVAMIGNGLWLTHDLSALTVSDKTVTWPDKDGTVAMLDDITGGGAVDSVNSQTGVVVLDADDIDDTSTTNKFATAAELSKLAGIEASADVTDTANVTSAGALMDSELTDITAVKALSDASASDVNAGTSTTMFVTPDALNDSLYRKVTISGTEPGSPEDGDLWVDTSEVIPFYSAELNVIHQGQHTQYLDGVSASEIYRYVLPAGQKLVLTGIEVLERGGGTQNDNFTIQIYDVTNSTQLAICSLNQSSTLAVTTSAAITYSLRVTNGAGTDKDACFTIRGYYIYGT